MTYGYDATTGRFNAVNSMPGTAEAQTFTYDYLPDSNMLETLSANSGLTVTRQYESSRDVVTRMQNQFGSNVVSQYDYVYDALRRRASMITSGPAIDTLPQPTVPEQNITYTTNTVNQYTTVDTDGTEMSLGYDLDGSLTHDGRFEYVYNAENRMIAATPIDTASGLQKVEAAYDYMGRRISKKVSTHTDGAWTLDKTITFVYDGWNVITETIATSSGTSTVHYVWGLDLSGSLQGAGGIGGLLLRKTGTGTFAYVYDANGNVGQLVNVADGSLAAWYKYDPFGVLLVADGPEAEKNPFRFSTKYVDAETGLYYYGHRYYASELGRWTTRDPIEESGGYNLYAFIKNTPLNAIDPLGTKIYDFPHQPTFVDAGDVIQVGYFSDSGKTIIMGTVTIEEYQPVYQANFLLDQTTQSYQWGKGGGCRMSALFKEEEITCCEPGETCGCPDKNYRWNSAVIIDTTPGKSAGYWDGAGPENPAGASFYTEEQLTQGSWYFKAIEETINILWYEDGLIRFRFFDVPINHEDYLQHTNFMKVGFETSLVCASTGQKFMTFMWGFKYSAAGVELW